LGKNKPWSTCLANKPGIQAVEGICVGLRIRKRGQLPAGSPQGKVKRKHPQILRSTKKGKGGEEMPPTAWRAREMWNVKKYLWFLGTDLYERK